MKTILVEFHNGTVELYAYPSLKALKLRLQRDEVRYKRMRIDGSKRWVMSGRKWSAS